MSQRDIKGVEQLQQNLGRMIAFHIYKMIFISGDDFYMDCLASVCFLSKRCNEDQVYRFNLNALCDFKLTPFENE